MSLDLLVDSDVITKLCIYSLRLWDYGGLLHGRNIASLAVCRYVVPKRLKRAQVSGNREAILSTFANFLERASLVEPAPDEIELAAVLELSAQRLGISFDIGESQLLAVMVKREANNLLTGDKRAVVALSRLSAEHAEPAAATGKVACLEQLFIELVESGLGESIRANVCSEPKADTVLSICFRCLSDASSKQTYLDGLRSYVNNLRKNSGDVLCKSFLSRSP